MFLSLAAAGRPFRQKDYRTGVKLVTAVRYARVKAFDKKFTQRLERDRELAKQQLKEELDQELLEERKELEEEERLASEAQEKERKAEELLRQQKRDSPQKREQARSRFSSASVSASQERIGHGILKLPEGYKTKSPADIEREIKQQFKISDVDFDPAFAESVIEDVKDEEKFYLKILNGDEEQRVEFTKAKLLELIYSVIDEAKTQIDRVNEKIQGKKPEQGLLNMMNSELLSLFSPKTIGEVKKLQEAGPEVVAELESEGGLKMFPGLVKRLDEDSEQFDFDLETRMDVFELATQIPDAEIREQCIFHAGNLLYKHDKRLRADPINELFYIQSLINRNFTKACYLFESRREKSEDVQSQRFWLDLGIEIYMKKSSISQAIAIANEIENKFGYLTPTVIQQFIKFYLKVESPNEAYFWWLKLLNIAEQDGISEDTKILGNIISNDKQKVYDYYNRIEPVEKTDLTAAFFWFIDELQFKIAIDVLKKICSFNNEMFVDILKQLLKTTPALVKEGLYQTLLATNTTDLYVRELQSELELDRSMKVRDMEQFNLMVRILDTLGRSIQNGSFGKERIAMAHSLVQSLRRCDRLTSRQCKALLDIILTRPTRSKVTLAVEILGEANKSHALASERQPTFIFPPADPHIYITFIQMIGRRKTDNFKELELMVESMESMGIQQNIEFLTQLSLTYSKHHRHRKAIELIDNFLATKKFRSSQFSFCVFLKLYRRSLLEYEELSMAKRVALSEGKDLEISDDSNKENFNYNDPVVFSFRLQSLRDMFKLFITKDKEYWAPGDAFFRQSIKSFLAYGDEYSAICSLEYLGMERQKELSSKLYDDIREVLAKITTDFLSNPKISDDVKEELTQFQNSFLSEQQTSSGMDLNWRDATGLILKLKDITGYDQSLKSAALKGVETTASVATDFHISKAEFEIELNRIQRFYELPVIELEYMQ